jgi:parallel beta-helix repeat protein
MRSTLSGLGLVSALAAACGGSSAPSGGDGPLGGGTAGAGGSGATPTMYVDGKVGPVSCTDYSPSARSCGGGSGRAYRTLQGAADAAVAGDVVQVRAGSYNERLIPGRSGTEALPVIFTVAQGETATLTNLDEPAIFLKERSYVVVEGFTVTNVVGWARLEDSSYNTLRKNAFSRATASGTTGGVKLVRGGYNRIQENTLEDGNDSLVIQDSDRNVVQGNTFTRGRHSLLSLRCGNYNVIRGNSFSNPDQKNLEIYDCEGTSDAPVKLDATKRNLVERNVMADTHASSADYRYNGIQYGGQQGIVRRNVFRDNAGGGVNFQYYRDESLYNNRNRVYHNTFYNNRCFGIVGANGDARVFFDNRARNNILYRNTDCAGAGGQTSIANPSRVVLSDNAVTTAPPGFADEANRDLQLAAGSPMIDAAAYLTTATTAGSGTRLSVADASYFFDGYGIPQEGGDEIQLEGQAESARVVSVDLGANTLTLDHGLTWTAGQGVALRFAGLKPDLGAHESGLPQR